MNVNDVLAQNGLEFHDVEQAVAELAELDNDELWTITEQLMGDAEIGIQGDEDTQANILRITLANAFSNNAEGITQSDIDLAQETALSLETDLEDAEPEEQEAAEESQADESESTTETKTKRTRRRTSQSRQVIKDIVQANPDMLREDVLSEATAQGLSVSADTAMMYFYDVRNELGLEPNGKRGRKKTNTIERVKELIVANPDLSRKEYITLIHTELGYAESSASVYYHKAQNEINN